MKRTLFATVVGWSVFIWPGQNRDVVDRLAKKNATVFAMDSVPRITRAQKMDTLSAMANIAGYRASLKPQLTSLAFSLGKSQPRDASILQNLLVIGAGCCWPFGNRLPQRFGCDRACLRSAFCNEGSGRVDGRRISRA
jgi:hypothetical protein